MKTYTAVLVLAGLIIVIILLSVVCNGMYNPAGAEVLPDLLMDNTSNMATMGFDTGQPTDTMSSTSGSLLWVICEVALAGIVASGIGIYHVS